MKIGTVCSGIGAPEVALKELSEELGFDFEMVFACEIDKYARASYNAIHSTRKIYEDMTAELWDEPEQYSDLFIGGIPCQSFSLAGKRLGELDPRGLLFFDFYRYVKNQQPKVFIIENVKGLLSDNKGKTFQNWLLLLGNSVNGHSQMFNHTDSLGYNLHHTVLNSKNFGVPQNRERVFIVGIRSDLPNDFRFPVGWKLDKRLKDILENDVDEKYYLSKNALEYMSKPVTGSYSDRLSFMNDAENETSGCITANHSKDVPYNCLKVKEPTNLQGKKYINTIQTGGRSSLTIKHNWDMVIEPFCVAMRGRNSENASDRATGAATEQRLEQNSQGITNTITSVQKDNLIVEPSLKMIHTLSGGKWDKANESSRRIYDENGIAPTILTMQGGNLHPKTMQGSRIRRLTPLECWRLQGFPDEAFYKTKQVNSDTQLYKQAGNSMTTTVMKAILKNLITTLLH